MEQKDIEAYKREMMKLYSKLKPVADEKIEEMPQAEQDIAENTTEENAVETIVPEEEIPVEQEENEIVNTEEYDDKDYADAEHDTSYYPYTMDEEEAEIERIINNAQLSESGMPSQSEVVSASELGNSTGYILVNVRTGREATPIVGASVVVTAINEGNRLLIATGISDISGTVLKIEVPAPDEKYSQTPDTEVRPYSLFDISVRATGFFNARSVDVPVFSGITSIQNFNMIPLPLYAETDSDTLTYFNQEPF